MIQTFPKKIVRTTIITIQDEAMGSHEVDLNDLRACARRELAFRERVYPKWIDKGTLKPAKAAKEIELMRRIEDFLIHCILKAVTRRESPPS